MGLKINVGKSKVFVVTNDQRGSCEKVMMNGKEMQEVDRFQYLGVIRRKWLIGYWREERYGNDGTIAEGEHDI